MGSFSIPLKVHLVTEKYRKVVEDDGVGSNSWCDDVCLQLHCSRVRWRLQWHGVKGRLYLQKSNTSSVCIEQNLPLQMIWNKILHVNTISILRTLIML
jgi:hypothetical protein